MPHHKESQQRSGRGWLASSRPRAAVDAAWQKTKLTSKMEDRCSIGEIHQWTQRTMSITKTDLRHPNERLSNVQYLQFVISPVAQSLWCTNAVPITQAKVHPDCQKSCHKENWVQLKTIESKSLLSSQSQLYEVVVHLRVEAPTTVRFAWVRRPQHHATKLINRNWNHRCHDSQDKATLEWKQLPWPLASPKDNRNLSRRTLKLVSIRPMD